MINPRRAHDVPAASGDRLDTDILWGLQNSAGTCCVLTGMGVMGERCQVYDAGSTTGKGL